MLYTWVLPPPPPPKLCLGSVICLPNFATLGEAFPSQPPPKSHSPSPPPLGRISYCLLDSTHFGVWSKDWKFIICSLSSEKESLKSPCQMLSQLCRHGLISVVLCPMFPLSWARARPRSNWNAAAHNEMSPRSSNFSIFIVNILIMHITKNV
jgi:hypothetical protein